MDVVRRPVVHDVKLYSGAKEPMIGSLCVSAYYLLYSTRRHEGDDEITVSGARCSLCVDGSRALTCP